jgi:FkbM family methyltransferase
MEAPETHSAGHLSGLLDVSQNGEAGVVAALVEPGWPRYLVDVGAHDGRSLSNSFPFLQLGWAGVVIEPLPQAFARLAELYARRPDVLCVPAACAASDSEMRLVAGDDGPSTMTSTLRAGAPGKGGVSVKVRTLTSLLDECGTPHDFSLLLVDAEGMDHEVLSGLDFERYRPRVIVTEDGAGDAAKYRLLQERGYVLYAVVAATNSIWVSSAFAREASPLTHEEAIRTISRDTLERRCAELERSRDEIWRELMVVQTSRSWRLTRPLRYLGRRFRERSKTRLTA